MMFRQRKTEARGRRLSLRRSERGAILIHTAIAFVGLTAFSTFVADYGMLWTARRQAQNAADSAALAAASSLGYVDINDLPLARAAAITAGQANLVWGQAPIITNGDIAIGDALSGVCPADAPPNGICVRADVFRNQTRGNPLPTWFGSIVGVSTQGVRATATAEVRFGRASAECIKPLAIPDKWREMQTPAWDLTDEFNLVICQGRRCVPASPPDQFVAGTAGTGFVGSAQRDTPPGGIGDLGLQVTIKFARGQSDLEPGMYAPVRLGTSSGATDYRNNIEGCWNGTVSPGDQLGVEPGGKAGPTRQAFDTLVARDPSATWAGAVNGLGGGVAGGCEAAGTCGLSPRVIPIIAFDPTVWAQDPNGGPGAGGPGGPGGCQQGADGCAWNGPGSVTVTQILGVFIEEVRNNNQIVGRIMSMPTLGLVGTGEGGNSNVVNIVLVR